jgi:hypothetical protein
MEHDWNELRLYFEVFVFVFNAALAAYLWWTNKNRVTQDRIHEMEHNFGEQVKLICTRLQRVEIEGQHAPKHTDLLRLHERIDSINNNLQHLLGEFKEIRTGVVMIQQFLLQSRDDGR